MAKTSGCACDRQAVSRAVRRAIGSAGTISLALAASLAIGAVAQAQQTDTGSANQLEEVTVTGTRIVRDGYEAPTPVSVLGADDLNAMAETNVAYGVKKMPVFSGGASSHSAGSTVSDGTGGVNTLDLRGLSPGRTLVLLDGKRVVNAVLTGIGSGGADAAPDVNAFPNALIERVEVVTGGASAVYGSDALAGVVNFILDKDFTGLKGTIEGGMTGQKDDETYTISLTGGVPFADGRGHFLFSGEHAYEDGVVGIPRDWADAGYNTVRNPNYTPTSGQPQYLTLFDVGLSDATRGGLIISCPLTAGGPESMACPLRGTQFLEGGTPAQFNFGPFISGHYMSGGDWRTSRIDQDASMALQLQRDSVFTRASWDLTDRTNVFAEVQWSRTMADNEQSVPNFMLGSVTVLSGNPFIPASVQAAMTANGIESFKLGTTNADMPNLQAENWRTFTRYMAGIEGSFGALGTDWNWNAYVGTSQQDITQTGPGNFIRSHFARAIDAVVDPASGRTVCRVNTDADPANDDSACVPYNPMGIGVNSSAAIDYVVGRGWARMILQQDVGAVSATGEPFSTWAGPVSIAFGAEHRRESVKGKASAMDEANDFFAGNYHASHGEYDVTEGFLETVVPLVSGKPFAESLDFNGAVRLTDYSTSGEVTTWKLGASWQPIDDVRFRVTRSRDIRAPNLGDLYNGGQSGTGNIFDPVTNVTRTTINRVSGNPNLQPEEADTTGIGIVLTPSFLPGFGASIDYYDISIEGAITSLRAQDYVDRCYDTITPQPELCPFVHRDNEGFIDFVAAQPANILEQNATGFDVEATYSFALSDLNDGWSGNLTLRGLATIVDSLETVDGRSTIERAGALGNADFRYIFTAAYDNGPAKLTLTARGTGPLKYDNTYIECVSDCPAATVDHPTIDNNHIDGVTYFDLAFNYTLFGGSSEVFLVLENVLDEDPPLIAGSVGNGYYTGQANSAYDRLGRIIRTGMRFQF